MKLGTVFEINDHKARVVAIVQTQKSCLPFPCMWGSRWMYSFSGITLHKAKPLSTAEGERRGWRKLSSFRAKEGAQ